MKIYKEFKELTKLYGKIKRIVEKLEEKVDLEGIHIDTARLVSMTKEELSNFDLVDDEYYVSQSRGYLEDDFYGYLWFATDVPGQYVQVYFSTY